MLPITLCGNDATLLTTRKMLLEREGFRVQVARGVQNLPQHGSDALILCYTLSSREQREAVAWANRHHAAARILVLGGDVRDSLGAGCEALTAYPTPHVLVERARHLANQTQMCS